MPEPQRRQDDSCGLVESESITVQLRHVCLEYPYSTLENATQGFDESCKLGEGSAGSVYRVEMPDGSYAAVKCIDLAELGDNSAVAGFEDEIRILSKFRHPNLVVLMGWARKDARRFLLYEYLSGGDLSARLQKSKANCAPFLWHERLDVLRDAATGLAHLHNATPRAFHRDIKSANILLGAGSAAKMADFGLSCMAQNRTSSAFDCEMPSGTPGYACPIYLETGTVTEGSEVYSFGMVILETLLNLLPAGMMGDQIKFPIHDTLQFQSPGVLERAVAAADPTAGWPQQVASEVASLGLNCIQGDEALRPCFNDICKKLRALQVQFPPSCVLAPQMQPQTGPCMLPGQGTGLLPMPGWPGMPGGPPHAPQLPHFFPQAGGWPAGSTMMVPVGFNQQFHPAGPPAPWNHGMPGPFNAQSLPPGGVPPNHASMQVCLPEVALEIVYVRLAPLADRKSVV